MVARGEFLEYARVFGKHSYARENGWKIAEEGLRSGAGDRCQGARSVKKASGVGGDFILPPIARELERRLREPRQEFRTKRSRDGLAKRA